ncbi:MAG: orotidine-5'-phosphate decarboxylase [Pseudomonadota bacterium]
MNMPLDERRIIVALDFDTAREAVAAARRLDARRCRVKVGKELFTIAGPRVIEELHGLGFEVFLDLKFHDIPNTVAGACRAAARLGVWMVNVHASGGRRMMLAAREAIDAGSGRRPLLTAVTVLTSMDQDDLADIGIEVPVEDQVSRLALLAEDCALDGVVCSAREAGRLSQECRRGFLFVTPGIRPAGSAAGDQRRVVTPVDALRSGATHLVIGRPITGAADPVAILADIHAGLADAAV